LGQIADVGVEAHIIDTRAGVDQLIESLRADAQDRKNGVSTWAS
jgi:hypothetical protein